MEEQNKAQKAFEIDKSIRENELKRRKLFIFNILGLIQMYEEDLYKYILGEGVKPNWAGYLSDVEKYYTRSKIERWRKIINKFVKKFGINIDSIIEIPGTRLAEIAKISDNKEKAEELIMQAKVLTPLDFKNLIRKEKGLPTTDECEHKMVDYEICSRCGVMRRNRK